MSSEKNCFYSTKPIDYTEFSTGQLLYNETCAAKDIYPTDWSIPNRFSENHKISVVEVSLGDGMSLDKAEMSNDVLGDFFGFDAAQVADFVLGETVIARNSDKRYIFNISEIKSEFESRVLPAQSKPEGVDKYYAGAGLRFRIDTGDIGIYEALFEYDRDRDLSQPIFFYENDYTRLLYQQYIPAVDKLLGPFRDVNQDIEVTPPGDNYVDQIAGFLTGDFDYWYTLSKDVDFSEDTGNVVDVDWKFNNSVVKTQIVDEGASVKANDPILIIRTGEVDRSVVSPVNGRVNFSVSENDPVNDGSLLARITEQVLREYPKGSYFLVSGSGNSEGPFDSPEFTFQLPNEWEIKDQVRLGTDGSFILGNDESLPDEDKVNKQQTIGMEYNANKTQYTLTTYNPAWDVRSCTRSVDLESSRKLDSPKAVDEIVTDLLVPRVSISELSFETGVDAPALNFWEFTRMFTQPDGECLPRLFENNCFSFGQNFNFSHPICESFTSVSSVANRDAHYRSSNATVPKECMAEKRTGLWTTKPTFETGSYSFQICAPESLTMFGGPSRLAVFHFCKDVGTDPNITSGSECLICDPCAGEPPRMFEIPVAIYNCIDFLDANNPCIEGFQADFIARPTGGFSDFTGFVADVSPGQCVTANNKFGSTNFSGPKFDNVYSLEDEVNADAATLIIYGGLSSLISGIEDDLQSNAQAPELERRFAKEENSIYRKSRVNPMYRKIISKIKGVDSFDIRYELFGGTVKEIKVKKGDIVRIGTVLMTIEVGSTTREIVSPREGTIDNIAVDVGSSLSRNDVLASIFLSSELIFSPCEISVKEGEKFGTLAGDWRKQTGDPRRQDVNIYYRDLPEIDFNHMNLVGELSQLDYSKTKDDLDGPRAGMWVAVVPTKIEMSEAEGINSFALSNSEKASLKQAASQVTLTSNDRFGEPTHKGTYPITYGDVPRSNFGFGGSATQNLYPCPTKEDLENSSICRNPCGPDGEYFDSFYEEVYGTVGEDFDRSFKRYTDLIDQYKLFPNPYYPNCEIEHIIGESACEKLIAMGRFMGRPDPNDYGCDLNAVIGIDPLTDDNSLRCFIYNMDLRAFNAYALSLLEKARSGRNSQCAYNYFAPRRKSNFRTSGGSPLPAGVGLQSSTFFGKTYGCDADGTYVEFPMPEPIQGYLDFRGPGCHDLINVYNVEEALRSGSDVWDIVSSFSGSYGFLAFDNDLVDGMEKTYYFPASCDSQFGSRVVPPGCGQEVDVNNDGTINSKDEEACLGGGNVTTELELSSLQLKITKNIVSIKSYTFTIGDEGDIENA